jgi:hypothetical protein
MIRTILTVGLLISLVGFTLGQPIDEEFIGCRPMKARIAGMPVSIEDMARVRASKERSDTFDIIHYSIHLDVSDFGGRRLVGYTEVYFKPLMEGLDYIHLDLERLTVSKVIYNDEEIPYDHVGPLLKCFFPDTLSMVDTSKVVVYYGGTPMTSSSNFGGFYFENGYAYNLGIGITDQPHNYGRAWFPCFDNFVERSTYKYVITHQSVHSAHCVGTFISREDHNNEKSTTTYYMSQPIPTYLSSIAVSNYTSLDYTHEGKYGEVPIRLIARPNQLANMETSFENLTRAIDAFEHWFGPHIWERVGYVLTSRGAMEHPTNVAYPDFSVAGGSRNERLMAHELAHMWWGNNTTLKTAHDMWIKEGNAEYGAHLFTEFVYGHDAFIRQVMDNASVILRRAHIDDGEYLALSPMPSNQTYSTHTYNKGAMMMHNLRTYLGDEAYSRGMTKLLEENLYSALDAYEFRDQLSAYSGYDLTDYFEDWIFSPGYPTFEIDSFVTLVGHQGYEVELYIEQKLRARDRFCQNVPLEFVFYNANLGRYTTTAMVSGQFDVLNIKGIPFEPSFVVINESNHLNLGFQGNSILISKTGNQELPHTQMTLNIQEFKDSVWMRIEHHYTGADGLKEPRADFRVGKNRHWKVYRGSGEIPRMTATLQYNRAVGLDDDLVAVNADSLILIWRPNASVEWIEHPNYQKLRLPTAGLGQVRIFDLMAGEYALANGELEPTVGVKTIRQLSSVEVFPNPARDQVILKFSNDQSERFLFVADMNGKEVIRQKIVAGAQDTILDIQQLISGTYLIQIEDQFGRVQAQSKLVRQ